MTELREIQVGQIRAALAVPLDIVWRSKVSRNDMVILLDAYDVLQERYDALAHRLDEFRMSAGEAMDKLIDAHRVDNMLNIREGQS